MAQAGYGDEADSVILSTTDDVLAGWAGFEQEQFERLTRAQSGRFGTVLNAGAGRRISETEAPFLERFDQWILLEPDDERRTALGRTLGDRPATMVGSRIEQIDPDSLGPVDCVLCKYVLQHVPTKSIGPAVTALRSVTAAGGRIVLFLAVSGGARSEYRLVVPIESVDKVPKRLLRNAERSDRQASARINRRQFDRLMTETQRFPFIATHHFGNRELSRAFPGFVVVADYAGVAVLEASV